MKPNEMVEGLEVTFKSAGKRGRKGCVLNPNWEGGEGYLGGCLVLWEPQTLLGSSLFPNVEKPSTLIPWEQFCREEQEKEAEEKARRLAKIQTLAQNRARSLRILDRLKTLRIESGALRVDVWDKLESRDLETLLEDLLTRAEKARG